MTQEVILNLMKEKLRNLGKNETFSYKEVQNYVCTKLKLKSVEDKNKCRSKISFLLTILISSGVLSRKNKNCDNITLNIDSYFKNKNEFILNLVKVFSNNYKANAATEDYEKTNSGEIAMKYRIKNPEVQKFLILNQLWDEDRYQDKLMQFEKNKIAFNKKKLKEKTDIFVDQVKNLVSDFKDQMKKAKTEVILELAKRNQLKDLDDLSLVDAYNHLSSTI